MQACTYVSRYVNANLKGERDETDRQGERERERKARWGTSEVKTLYPSETLQLNYPLYSVPIAIPEKMKLP